MSGLTPEIAVIGGSGFYSFFDDATERVVVDTPFGSPSASIAVGEVAGRLTAFIPRHGEHQPNPGAQDPVSGQHVGAPQPRRPPGSVAVRCR